MGLLDYFSVFDLWQVHNKGAAAFSFYYFTRYAKEIYLPEKNYSFSVARKEPRSYFQAYFFQIR